MGEENVVIGLARTDDIEEFWDVESHVHRFSICRRRTGRWRCMHHVTEVNRDIARLCIDSDGWQTIDL